eukprot:Em0001g854a
MSADWSNGLCGCFNDCGICVITYFLPCYTFGKNAEAVGESCCLCCLCYGCSPYDLAAKVAVRGKIRDQKGIAGTIAGDIVYHVFCSAYRSNDFMWCRMIDPSRKVKPQDLIDWNKPFMPGYHQQFCWKCGPHPFLTSQTDAWRFEPPETPGSYGYVVTYRLRSLSLFQGMASPALVANTSAAPSSIDDEIPALSNKDRLSSSLRMRTSFWSMNRQLWFLGSCMMSLSGLVEMAHFSNPTAFFSFSGQQEYQIGAGLTWEETKGPPSEQQGQFTALDAAIHFWRHLAHTSAPHCSSSGCERMLEHTAHFSSFSINWD